jgi:hypothetical protein
MVKTTMLKNVLSRKTITLTVTLQMGVDLMQERSKGREVLISSSELFPAHKLPPAKLYSIILVDRATQAFLKATT